MSEVGTVDIEADRWVDLHKILNVSGPFAQEWFEAGEYTCQHLHHTARVLIIGAGGLGCELLKNLAMSGFKDIHVIDLDEVDVTNLNRQFLFRASDVGKSKALAAASFINKRVPGAKVVPHHCKIQDIEELLGDRAFYKSFNVVVCGLDSVAARRWMNNKLMSLIELDSDGNVVDDTIIPMIDGGSEEFKGQARIIIPGSTACYECSTDTLVKEEDPTHISCTVASTPRNAGHCVQYAALVLWDKAFPDRAIDNDSPVDMQWLYERAAERASEFGIMGVTLQLTSGVVKRIIPAIASTNAIIAAACANEVLKCVIGAAHPIDNWMFYNGQTGINTTTMPYARKESCPICKEYLSRKSITVSRHELLSSFIARLATQYKATELSLRLNKDYLYTPGPPPLEAATRPNLSKTLGELLSSDADVAVVDSRNTVSVTLRVKYED